MNYIDLTTKVEKDHPMMIQAAKKENPLAAMGHIGTHLDTYLHHPIPLEYICSRGILFDVRGLEEAALWDVPWKQVQEGDFVLFRTGRMEETSYGTEAYFAEHPCLSRELILKLTEKKVHFIGIDAPGIRRHEEHTKADCFCEDRGVYVIENISGLEKIAADVFEVYTMWLDDPDMSGLKCRVVAAVKEEDRKKA